MEINSEIYDNLYDFIQNLEIRIQKECSFILITQNNYQLSAIIYSNYARLKRTERLAK